ncbi:SGNH/GDSL hydrolase family protein [Rariglobus hedericola]|uniref:GDSL family lipase n=1 Tax=Rariglobus hedericola TaxID=2597822 RepID=A0A556QSB8_9BACT|nr:SGNH/GDSL hydrolase family protein [Rariglobus hedericola]TSJ79536.1 GDSL family lipase [Rariglobus hedericola]
MKFTSLFSGLALLASGSSFAPSLFSAEIAPTDSLIRYVGRFDDRQADAPRAAWSASTVAFTVSGGSVSVKFNDKGNNLWQVVIDGRSAGVLTLQAGEKVYTVASDLPAGSHHIELVKRTEASLGNTNLLGLTIDDGAKLLPTPARARRIEVIGDSISCGFGNEAASKEEKFSAATENAWLAYGAVAARAVNADYVCIAWSGKKLWPDNTIVELYDRVLPYSATPVWSFKREIPDVVVINLGTNDFNAKVNPEEAGWVAAYVQFIQRVRSHYPKAQVYCAVGTMLGDWNPERKVRTTILGYIDKVITQSNEAGGPPVRLIDFGVQKAENGIGASWHPSAKTHALMGAQLADTLKRDLGW